MTDLATRLYDIAAILEILILAFVISQVDRDRINNLDPRWVRLARKTSFLGAQLFLGATMYCQSWLWQPCWFDFGLIAFGDLILGVNIISLYLRSPPRSGHKYHPPMVRAFLRRTLL